MIVLLVGIFFMMHEFIEGIDVRNSYLYFELFELLGFICIVSFLYKWHSTLKTCTHKKPVQDILLEACISHKAGVEYNPFGWVNRINNRINKLVLTIILSLAGLILTIAVPISTLFFTLVLGTLFIPPILVFVSMLIGASSISKELNLGQAWVINFKRTKT